MALPQKKLQINIKQNRKHLVNAPMSNVLHNTKQKFILSKSLIAYLLTNFTVELHVGKQ